MERILLLQTRCGIYKHDRACCNRRQHKHWSLCSLSRSRDAQCHTYEADDKLKKLFRAYDTEGKGVLTFDQFRMLMKETDRKGEQTWYRRIQQDTEHWTYGNTPMKLLSILYKGCIKGTYRSSTPSILLSCAGMFLSMMSLGCLASSVSQHPWLGYFHKQGAPFFVGSFATLSILIFGNPKSPNLRMWNFIMGHIIGTSCGYLSVELFGHTDLARATALTTTLGAMMWTGSLHPPGGTLAMLMVQDPKFHLLKYLSLVYPALAGALVVYFFGWITSIMVNMYSKA